MIRFDAFTDDAQYVAEFATQIILHFHHQIINTEHILLALVEYPDGIVQRIFITLGVSPTDFGQKLVNILSSVKQKPVRKDKHEGVYISPQVKQLIDISAKEAFLLGDNKISSEHMFLAIFEDESSKAYQLLKQMKIHKSDVVKAIGDIRKKAKQHEEMPKDKSPILESLPETIERQGSLIKILFLGANPTDTTRLRLDEEIRSIDQAFRGSDFRNLFEIKQHWAVRSIDIQAYLLRHKPEIVHFSGHGNEASEIIVEDNYGNSHPLSTKGLRQLFSVLKDNIRCVVLNSCYSKTQAEAIAENIDCVIGMSKAISDKSAIAFAGAFYQALGYGRDVRTAFELGCIQVEFENLPQSEMPVLIAPKQDPSKIIFI